MANAYSKDLFQKQHAEILRETNRFQALLTNLRYEGKPRFGVNIHQTRGILKFLKNEVTQQFRFEEKVLFPFLRRHIPKLEPAVRLLEAEHDEFQSQLKNFQKTFSRFTKVGQCDSKVSEDLRETGTYLVYLLRHHINAESRIYKATSENLRTDERAELRLLMDEKHDHEKRRDQRAH